MTSSVQQINSELLCSDARFQVQRERFRTPDGEIERAIIHHPGSVAIIAQPDPEHILMVRQYRYSLQRETIEIPAGTLGVDEDPLLAAKRELEEETGHVAGSLEQLMSLYPAVGICDELQYFYRATNLSRGQLNPDQGEFIEPLLMDRNDVMQAIAEGMICDSKTFVALSAIGFDQWTAMTEMTVTPEKAGDHA
ncbi:MAG: NUDIX hydrolase [Planctomycetes bacterium]|nr:NUDIX hydrolase [Planctomycetota bacterium]